LPLEQLEFDADADDDAANVVVGVLVPVDDALAVVLVDEALVEVADATSFTMVPGVKSFIVLAAAHDPFSGKPQHHVDIESEGITMAPPLGLTELPLDSAILLDRFVGRGTYNRDRIAHKHCPNKSCLYMSLWI
jgi:hypothetical protein